MRQRQQLSDIASIFLGEPIAKAGALLPAIRVSDVASALTRPLATARFDPDQPGRRRESREVQAGDVLLTARGSRPYAAVVPARDSFRGALPTENLLVIRLHDHRTILPGVLALLLDAGGVAERIAEARTIFHLSPHKVRQWPVPVLPMEMQQAMADVLETTQAALAAAERVAEERRSFLSSVARVALGHGDEAQDAQLPLRDLDAAGRRGYNVEALRRAMTAKPSKRKGGSR